MVRAGALGSTFSLSGFLHLITLGKRTQILLSFPFQPPFLCIFCFPHSHPSDLTCTAYSIDSVQKSWFKSEFLSFFSLLTLFYHRYPPLYTTVLTFTTCYSLYLSLSLIHFIFCIIWFSLTHTLSLQFGLWEKSNTKVQYSTTVQYTSEAHSSNTFPCFLL